MDKVSILLYITVAVLVLFLISHSPKKPHHGRHHRRLRLRSSFNFTPSQHTPIPFDPLVADIERRREDRQWEKHYFEHAHPEFANDSAPAAESQPEWDDFTDAEDYLNDEEKFNVTGR